jgi:hypothetical protein
MEKRLTLLFSLILNLGIAQTIAVSDDISITSAEAYGIIGKFNDRVLAYTIDDNKVKLRALDAKMTKIWERDLEPERRNHAKVLDVMGTRQDFNMVYYFQKKNHTYVKVHKYDGQAKLLDSATIFDWGKGLLSPNLDHEFSEDRKMVLVYEIEDNRRLKALVIQLDSMKMLWQRNFDINEWYDDDRFEEVLLTNHGELILISEKDNRYNSEKHRFEIIRYGGGEILKTYNLPFREQVFLNVKFSYDNVNQLLVAAGLMSDKNFFKAQGLFAFSIPPQYSEGQPIFMTRYAFDDELASALLGKKVTDVKGIADLQIQDIIHRRDGGILAVVEQTHVFERRPVAMTSRFANRNFSDYIGRDYYHDNVIAFSVAPTGGIQWRSIFHKKQVSQDDGGKFSSYFIAKTPAALRFIFNDEIERSTTVSEFMLNGVGEGERHALMNTEGRDLYLRFRDALQVAANEIIVPSDDRRRIKMVRIQF